MGDGTRRRIRSTVVVTLAALALITGATACGGGDDDAGPTTTVAERSTSGSVPPNERALLQAARDYNRTQVEPAVDAEVASTAHRYLTTACQAELSEEDMERSLNEWVEERRATMGAAAEVLTVGQITVAEMNTSEAQVLVTLVTPTDEDPLGWGVPMRQRWIVEEGEWRIDPCTEQATIDSGSDQFAPVSVLTAGMHHMDGGGRWATNWAVVVRNPNPDAAAYDVAVTIDFVDADGEVLKTLEESILAIEPGQAGAVAGLVDAPDAVTVDVKARAGSWAPTDAPLVLEGTVSRVERFPPEPGYTVSTTDFGGTVTNTTEIDLGAIPVVVFVDAGGAVRGGSMEEITSFGYISPGGTREWQTFVSEMLPEDWTFRVYVTPTAPDYEWERILAEEGLGEG